MGNNLDSGLGFIENPWEKKFYEIEQEIERTRASQDAEKYALLCDRWGFEPIDIYLYERGIAELESLKKGHEVIRKEEYPVNLPQSKPITINQKPDYISFYNEARFLNGDFGEDLDKKRELIAKYFPKTYKKRKHLDGKRFGAFFNNLKIYSEKRKDNSRNN